MPGATGWTFIVGDTAVTLPLPGARRTEVHAAAIRFDPDRCARHRTRATEGQEWPHQRDSAATPDRIATKPIQRSRTCIILASKLTKWKANPYMKQICIDAGGRRDRSGRLAQ